MTSPFKTRGQMRKAYPEGPVAFYPVSTETGVGYSAPPLVFCSEEHRGVWVSTSRAVGSRLHRPWNCFKGSPRCEQCGVLLWEDEAKEPPLILRRVKAEALIAASDFAKDKGYGETPVLELAKKDMAYIIYGGDGGRWCDAVGTLSTILPYEECFVRLIRWGREIGNKLYLGSPNRVFLFEKAALEVIFRKCGLPKPSKYIRSLTENCGVTPVPRLHPDHFGLE